MAGDVDGFPPIVSYLIYFGGGLGLFFGWLFGGRKHGETPDERDTRIEALEKALANQHERDQTDRDLAVLRRDIEGNLQQIVRAMREATDKQIEAINRQLIDLGRQVRRLSRREPKGRQP